MLSNPPPPDPSPFQRPHLDAHHMHRRQHSTPSAFEDVKIPSLPGRQSPPQHRRAQKMAHRRGLSLDTRWCMPETTRAEGGFRPVSTPTRTTNTGFTTTPQRQHHVLRETQPQSSASPGPRTQIDRRHPVIDSTSLNHINKQFQDLNRMGAGDEGDLLSPQGIPHRPQRFVDMASPDMFALDAMVKKNEPNYIGNPSLELFGPESALSNSSLGFMTFPETSPASQLGWISDDESSRRSSRRISNALLDEMTKFDAMGTSMDGATGLVMQRPRPATPPGQNISNCFLLTPGETPYDGMSRREAARPNRFAEGYDESMEETLKPVRNKRASNRNSAVFFEMRQQAEGLMGKPPQPMGFGPPLHTPQFIDMSHVNAEFVKIETHRFDGLPPQSAMTTTPDLSTHPVSPMTPHFGPFAPFSDNMSSSSAGAQASGHRRTDSLASIASAASIASINIDETKTDTGVTLDEIALYMEGPDPSDGRWLCTFENCMKRFGRKENIKSHVQTHLNDRQYQCPTCKKCFVRQHDLKRHAKIHTGIKPYPCDCGNSFARHDALTRHRQRGMCIGAFDGIVRKIVKRGRPRKNKTDGRPDMYERREKSARARKKNREREEHSGASSQCGHSDSSAVDSPGTGTGSEDFDAQAFCAEDMLDMLMGNNETGSPIDPGSNPAGLVTLRPSDTAMSSAPMPTALVSTHAHTRTSSIAGIEDMLAVLSPTDNASVASPSALSAFSHLSDPTQGIAPIATTIEPHDMPSPATNSYMRSPPPGLSASTSPPPSTTTNHFFGAGNQDGERCSSSRLSGLGDGHDHLLLQAYTHDEDSVIQLDRELLMAGKFDEGYDVAVNMYCAGGDDFFFGS